jgi:uncharacterized protein with HEPN domain
MKNSYFDPEINKEYLGDNIYESKIQSFADSKQHSLFDVEVIEYALSLKNEIIGELDKNSSKSDKISIEHIKWIEKYLNGIHDFLIQQKLDIPQILEKHRSFIYRKGKRKVGRHKGIRNALTIKKYNWIRNKYYFLKKEKKAHTIDEHARLIRSELLKKLPDFWDNHTYELETIIDIIKKRKWGD